MEVHMGRQTEALESIARQGEQILSCRRSQEENRDLIETLFKQSREREVSSKEFREMIVKLFYEDKLEPIRAKNAAAVGKTAAKLESRLSLRTGLVLLLLSVAANFVINKIP